MTIIVMMIPIVNNSAITKQKLGRPDQRSIKSALTSGGYYFFGFVNNKIVPSVYSGNILDSGDRYLLINLNPAKNIQPQRRYIT